MDVPVTEESYKKLINALIVEIKKDATFDERHGAAVVKSVVYMAKMLEETTNELQQLRSEHNLLVRLLKERFEATSKK